MSIFFSAANLLAWSVQIALVVVAGAAAAAGLRLRMPAAALAWRQALLAACLLLPALQPWQIVETQTAAGSGITFESEAATGLPAAPPARMSPAGWLLLAIAAGIAGRACLLAAGCFRLWRIRRRAAPIPAPFPELEVRTGRSPRYYLSPDLDGPVTFGLLHPAVVLPGRFEEMEPERRLAICAHELLHVKRRDWAFVLAEESVRSLLWFHPAVWWLVSRIRLSREQVVDRAVVEVTGAKRPYLDALLEIAGEREIPLLAPAPSFLKKRHLKERVAMLVKEMNMSKKRAVLAAFAAALCSLFAGFAAVRAFPLEAAVDPTAAPSLAGVLPSPPTLEMPAKPAGTPVAMQQGPYRIGDGVTPPSLIHKQEPKYTEDARSAKVQGTVVLRIVVGSDGVASDITVKRSLDAGLDEKAVEAVRQWRFKPGMKDGVPVPVEATVEVNFRLFDGPKNDTAGVEKPQLMYKVEPGYTQEAREAKIEGTVLLGVDVNAEGQAENITVEKGIDAGLDRNAVEAVGKWRFRPAMKDGQPFKFHATIEVNFRLR